MFVATEETLFSISYVLKWKNILEIYKCALVIL